MTSRMSRVSSIWNCAASAAGAQTRTPARTARTNWNRGMVRGERNYSGIPAPVRAGRDPRGVSLHLGAHRLAHERVGQRLALRQGAERFGRLQLAERVAGQDLTGGVTLLQLPERLIGQELTVQVVLHHLAEQLVVHDLAVQVVLHHLAERVALHHLTERGVGLELT